MNTGHGDGEEHDPILPSIKGFDMMRYKEEGILYLHKFYRPCGCDTIRFVNDRGEKDTMTRELFENDFGKRHYSMITRSANGSNDDDTDDPVIARGLVEGRKRKRDEDVERTTAGGDEKRKRLDDDGEKGEDRRGRGKDRTHDHEEKEMEREGYRAGAYTQDDNNNNQQQQQPTTTTTTRTTTTTTINNNNKEIGKEGEEGVRKEKEEEREKWKEKEKEKERDWESGKGIVRATATRRYDASGCRPGWGSEGYIRYLTEERMCDLKDFDKDEHMRKGSTYVDRYFMRISTQSLIFMRDGTIYRTINDDLKKCVGDIEYRRFIERNPVKMIDRMRDSDIPVGRIMDLTLKPGRCLCDLQVRADIVKGGRNVGRKYEGCSRWKQDGGCGYFRWLS